MPDTRCPSIYNLRLFPFFLIPEKRGTIHEYSVIAIILSNEQDINILNCWEQAFGTVKGCESLYYLQKNRIVISSTAIHSSPVFLWRKFDEKWTNKEIMNYRNINCLNSFQENSTLFFSHSKSSIFLL